MALSELAPGSPEIFLAIMSMLLLMVGVFRQNSTSLVSILAILSFVITGGLILTSDSTTTTAFFGVFIVDGFAIYAKCLVLLASIIAVIMSSGYIQRENMKRFEFPVLITLGTLGMMMMISANDLMSLYVGLELQSLSLYILAAFRRDTEKSTEAGLKYFVLGALASGLLLFGMSLVYGYSGTTSFAGLEQIIHDSATFKKCCDEGANFPIGLIIGLVFMLCGLAFKISAVPFHMWTPDVYEGAPTPVTAFFAVGPKIAALALIMRVLYDPFYDMLSQWQQIVVALSILSMVVGALGAIWQTNIKRLMAYSSIGHVGYALVGLAAGTEKGAAGVLIYLAIYLFMNAGTFACILAMRYKDRMVVSISDLAGLGRTKPLMGGALMLLMFSMAGIPPLAGFFGKYFVFLAAIEAQLYELAVIGVLASVVSAFYYLRIIKIMYFDDPTESFDKDSGHELNFVMGLSTLVIVFFILYPNIVLKNAELAAATLFAQ